MTTTPDSGDRLGLNVPYEWWPGAHLLKEIEASGFSWVQIPAPPASVLLDPRACVRHACGIRESLATTTLRSVLHAPGGLVLGHRRDDAVFEGALSYAAEFGASQVVLHARSITDEPGREDELLAETRSIARASLLAERLGLTIAIENLAPLFPGPQPVSAIPAELRRLARRIGSDSVHLCLDVGHANVIAALRHTTLAELIEPVADSISLFHLHDNFGARGAAEDAPAELDPLKLDLHLAPGRGSLDWGSVASLLSAHRAPLLLEVHPPNRPSPGELASALRSVLARPAYA